MREANDAAQPVDMPGTTLLRTDNGMITLDDATACRESQKQRARRLFDEMARNIGREAVNHLKAMYGHLLTDEAKRSKSWETSLTNHVRNDINWRMRPLLMAMIAMHREWEEEKQP